MFGWFKKKKHVATVEQIEQDLVRFVLALRGANAEEIGSILACTYYWMTVLEEQNGWNLDYPDLIAGQDPTAVEKIVELLVEVRKRCDPALVTGLMVWLHTFRATTIPHLRLKGREMWAQLMRGMPHVDDGATAFQLFVGVQVNLSNAGRIPQNLLPSSPSGNGP
jgi:hypothetical protein